MKEYLSICSQAALDAGKEILEVYQSDFEVIEKNDASPLTLADQKAHQVIVKYLEETNIPILSEEGKNINFSERSKWDTFWLVDPLDGTKEFIKKNGEFTVNIALIKNGTPIMGVIYVPVNDVLYYGYEDKAIKIEEFSLGNSNELSLPLDIKKPFTLVGSRSHMSKETEDYFNEMKSVHGKVEIISVGSSLKLCMVAEGKANVYPRFAPTMEWDTAAGHAIVKASGHEVYNVETKSPLTYNKSNLLNPWFIVK